MIVDEPAMRNKRIKQDRSAEKFMRFLVLFSSFIALIIALALYIRSRPLLAARPLNELLFSLALGFSIA